MKIIIDSPVLKEVMNEVSSKVSDLTPIEIFIKHINKMPMMNSDTSPYIDTEQASKRGQEFMKVVVEDMEFNS